MINKVRIIIFYILITLSAFFLLRCKEKETQQPGTDLHKNTGVFVANEGTFTFGNASLHYINLTNDSLNTNIDIFKQVNGRPLGDIFQSIALIDDKLWLIVNNSGKIEVIEPQTGVSVKTIKGLRSPRYALKVSPTKVYVSDLYSQSIHCIDPLTMAVTGSIRCSGWTEEMLLQDGMVWVCNHDRDYVYIIDPDKDQVTDSINVAFGGSSILSDKQGMIWLLCSGDELKNKTGGLFGINPKDKKIIHAIYFDNTAFNPVKLKQNLQQDSLYFVYNGIYSLAKSGTRLPQSAFILQPTGSSFYGLAVNPTTGELLVADALDYQSRGYVRRYSSSGAYIKKYQVGVVPGEFLFW